MNKIEKLILTIILGFIPPVLFFVILWFGMYLLFPESKLIPYSIIGLILGIVIDFIFMKQWLSSCYKLPVWILVFIFSFYHIGMIGFFMGVPIFNSLLGILAGYYFGHRILKASLNEGKKKKMVFNISLLSAFAMFLICILSGTIALSDPTTPMNLKGMFGLNSEPTKEILITLILSGGIGLIAFTWWTTQFTMRKVLNKN